MYTIVYIEIRQLSVAQFKLYYFSFKCILFFLGLKNRDLYIPVKFSRRRIFKKDRRFLKIIWLLQKFIFVNC